MKKKLLYRTWFRFVSFVMLLLSSLIFWVSMIVIIYMYDQGIYYETYEEYMGDIYSSYSEYDGQDFYISVAQINATTGEAASAKEGVGATGPIEVESHAEVESIESVFAEEVTTDSFESEEMEEESAKSFEDTAEYEEEYVAVSPEEYVYYDANFSEELRIARILYEIKFVIIPVAVISLIVAAAFFVSLLCSAGHNGANGEIVPSWDHVIWFDVECVVALPLTLYSMLWMLRSFDNYTDLLYILFCLGIITVLELVDTGLCMSFASRIKNGNWWKNTLIYNCICRPVKWILGLLIKTIQRIPFVWMTTIGLLLYFAINVFVVFADGSERDNMLIFWLLQAIILIPLVIYIAYQGKKLKVAIERLSQGDLDYKLDTKGMYSIFKENAENLNCIGDGMSKALDERVKSERMKTELISNVSHDIKTPLTSLINYTDLITREECDNEKIREYSEVLHKNAERLKRLMEDIIEASKASSGAMDINLEPCDAGIVLSQIAGEYEEKLEQAKLSLILKEPEENLSILADSRRLWRVFDNVLNNICKYSMPESRVYVTLGREDDKIVFTFKNTSKNELDINPEELMERFVRADASRKTEGNGLGLSIAKSLTELQNGTFSISIDGDLFKVTIAFPYIENP